MKQYWAYIHQHGRIVVKEWYEGNNYINEARASPFVKTFLEEPFEADSIGEAEKIATKLLNSEKTNEIKSVEFVEMKYQDDPFGGRNTYEVYTAENKKQALEFIETKSVDKKYYYIEVNVGDVNDPEVIVGLDIQGTYEA